MTGFLFTTVVVITVALIAFRVGPSYIEYFTVQKALDQTMLGVEQLTLTDADRARLSDPRVGGVILFARNFASSAQLRALTASIRAVRPALLIAVDHEGGRVQRFRDGEFSAIPPMRTLGEHWDSDPVAANAAAFEHVACVEYAGHA